MNGKGYEVFAPKVGEMLLLCGGAADGCHFNIPAGIPSALEKHLCEDVNVSLQTSMFTGERRDEDGAALAALRETQEPTVWQQQSSLRDTISINHLMKTCSPPTPSLRVCVCVLIILFFSSRERLQ